MSVLTCRECGSSEVFGCVKVKCPERTNEAAETEALDLVYAWLGGGKSARTRLTSPEYRSLVASIARALDGHRPVAS